MTRTFADQDRGPDPFRQRAGHTWRARAFVLVGLALAAVYTAATVASDAGAGCIGPLWMAAIAWTVVASLAAALWRGFHHGDWSAFSDYELPEDDDEFTGFGYGYFLQPSKRPECSRNQLIINGNLITTQTRRGRP